MPERLVVSFRGALLGPPPSKAGHAARVRHSKPEIGPSYLDRALATKKRAEAHGATLCAWSAQTFSFDFAPEELEEAVSLALTAAHEEVPAEERFGIGISHGALELVGEGGSLAVLSWGRPLVAAVSLARIAQPGEVLIDPEVPAYGRGELLTIGSRIALDGNVRVRGHRLDTAEPWRKNAARSVIKLVAPSLVGRDALLEDLAVPVGCLGLIRADPGAGGTRLLEELVARGNPSRWLLVTPVGASREPLGGIRRALARSAVLHGAPTLPDRLHAALHRLLAGEGADPWSVAEIIDTWLAPAEGRFGVLAIDDAAEINSASLEALANAINVRGAFRMIARLDSTTPLPDALAPIPAGSSISVAPLVSDDAQRLIASMAGGAISAEAVRRWARRGGGLPLGLRECVAEGLVSGELAWHAAVAVPRKRTAGRGGSASPRQWIERRMRFLSPGEKAVLTALAMLGGDASEPMVDELAVGMAGLGPRTALADATLVGDGWVVRPEPGWLKLCSRTAMTTIIASVPPEVRREWHLAAAATLQQHVGVLGLADAAWHAAEGGDMGSAARFAIEAATASAKASLEGATNTLFVFAHACDPAAAEVARRDSLRTPRGSIPQVPASSRVPLDGFEEGTLPISSRSDIPPRSQLDTMIDDAMFARFDPARKPAGTSRPRAPSEPLMSPKSVPPFSVAFDVADGPAERTAAEAEREALDRAARLAERARDALVQGDITTLEGLVTEMRATGEQDELVERMSGFIALGRGAKADALRRLRVAADGQLPVAQKARARLAYGVALAAAGRTETALLETLDALARAREAEDRNGENACARFLARLSSGAGHVAAAETWTAVAKRSTATE